MKNTYDFLKNMIIAGIIFFIPLVILIVILQKAFQILAVLVSPIIKLLNITNVFGIGAEIFISIILTLFLLYMGGLLAKTTRAKTAIAKLEESLLAKIPGYEVLKKLVKVLLDLKLIINFIQFLHGLRMHGSLLF